MAIYRNIQTSFWRDDFVTELEKDDKLFYLYLMSNPNTTQCGIFELPIKIVEVELGIDKDGINKIINKFVEAGKILYDKESKEIMILKWAKYNFNSSRNTLICINKELKRVKTKSFVKELYNICLEYEYDMDEIFRGIHIDVEVESKVETKVEIEKKPEAESKDESTDLSDEEGFKAVVQAFNNNIHPINPLEYKKLQDWNIDVECEVIKRAIDEAVVRNVRTMVYINGILNNWFSMGLTNIKAVDAYIRDYKSRKDKLNRKSSDTQNAAAYVVIEDS